eukprot:5301-Heterococcus_DN1.PRE.4
MPVAAFEAIMPHSGSSSSTTVSANSAAHCISTVKCMHLSNYSKAQFEDGVLEDYVLYYNYWRMNLKDGDLAFANQGKGNKGGDYFG